ASAIRAESDPPNAALGTQAGKSGYLPCTKVPNVRKSVREQENLAPVREEESLIHTAPARPRTQQLAGVAVPQLRAWIAPGQDFASIRAEGRRPGSPLRRS